MFPPWVSSFCIGVHKNHYLCGVEVLKILWFVVFLYFPGVKALRSSNLLHFTLLGFCSYIVTFDKKKILYTGGSHNTQEADFCQCTTFATLTSISLFTLMLQPLQCVLCLVRVAHYPLWLNGQIQNGVRLTKHRRLKPSALPCLPLNQRSVCDCPRA